MRQGTTPTHTFKLPCSASSVTAALITYVQGGKEVLKKTLADCTVGEDSLSLQLTQKETLAFAGDSYAQVQVRILTQDGKAMASTIDTFYVAKSLSEDVLEVAEDG